MTRSLSINLRALSVTINWPPATDRFGRRVKAFALRLTFPALLLLAALLLLWRDPYRLLDSQLWAEDGPLWIYDAYVRGFASLFIPHTGYLQTFPRLVGFITLVAPLAWVPTIFAAAGFLTQLAPAALLLSARGRALVPSLAARLLLAGYYLGVPNSFETFVNITNAQWHLVLIMFLLVEFIRPARAVSRGLQYAVLLVGGLSGPFSFFLAPIAWWRAIGTGAEFRFRATQAGILTATAVVQAGYVIASAGASRHLEPDGASIGGFARIIVGQIYLAALLGAGQMSRLEASHFWQGNLLPCALLLGFLAATAVALRHAPVAYWRFFTLALLIIASALWSPVISTTQPQWDALEVPGAGSRYYLLPIIAWFAALLILAEQKQRLLRWPARLLILVSLVGVRTDFHYPRQPETHFGDAAAVFAGAAPGTKVIFREAPNPDVWLFSLTKK